MACAPSLCASLSLSDGARGGGVPDLMRHVARHLPGDSRDEQPGALPRAPCSLPLLPPTPHSGAARRIEGVCASGRH
eukprot:SAG25_NODE_944_length_4650_cov_9.607119_6_plen_77_part_00